MSPTSTDSSSTAPPSTTIKKSSARPPSLNQLAARLNATVANAPTASGPRPNRLAAFALRTGSNTSLSTNDSVAVNASSTRAASPSGGSSTNTASVRSEDTAPDNNAGGEPLTTEKLEEFNKETAAVNAVKIPEVPRRKVGYKNIPSLDAISARLAKARSLSVDGSAMPPEPQMIEDPKTPGLVMKAPEHPLQFSWCADICYRSKEMYADTLIFNVGLYTMIRKGNPATGTPFNQPLPGTQSEPPFSASHPPESTEYEAGLTVVGEFATVEEFCRYFNWLKPPSLLEKNSNYHIFKSGIKPMWEDEANANGGKWVLTMKNNPTLLDRCWNWLVMALVGEELEDGDEICGAVVSLRSKVDRIQLWTRSKDDVDRLNGIGKKLVKLLDISEADSIGLEFQVLGFYKLIVCNVLNLCFGSIIARIDLPSINSCPSKLYPAVLFVLVSLDSLHVLQPAIHL
jgi:translation initiation factor 4E